MSWPPPRPPVDVKLPAEAVVDVKLPAEAAAVVTVSRLAVTGAAVPRPGFRARLPGRGPGA